MQAAISPAQLLRLEAELCRARNRSIWWSGVSRDAGAVGQMINQFLAERRSAAQVEGAGFEDLRQTRLLELLHKGEYRLAIPPATFSEFLSGKPSAGGKHDWFDVAPVLLRYILAGTQQLQGPHAELVERICRFFFPPGFAPGEIEADRNHTWFFHPRLRRLASPATSAEATAELRAMIYYCSHVKPQGSGLIVRTSGKKQFMQVEDGDLTTSGQVSIECLRAGVHVVFVYPKSKRGSDAAKTAVHFQTLASELLEDDAGAMARLHLLALEPGDVRKIPGQNEEIWAGEYLSRTLRFLFHRCDIPSGSASWSTLSVARSQKWGLCGFQTDDDDVQAFETWCRTFVYPEIGFRTGGK
jgi:hypothetical protein